MSTPINTLPLKTPQTGSSEVNDINDPIVQDVLNEFQDELMISKQPKMPPHLPSYNQPPSPYPPMQYPTPPNQQMMYGSHASHNSNSNHSNRNNLNKYDNISSYLDTEVAKKSLILVILAVIIYHSGIINTVYEKMPDYLQDNLTNFDIYIKSLSLFSIIYVLSFFEYI